MALINNHSRYDRLGQSLFTAARRPWTLFVSRRRSTDAFFGFPGRAGGYPTGRRVEGVVTQRPPPQIVACGFPALRSSEPGSQLSISLKPCIGDRQFRLYQRKALFELLELLPAYFAVLTSPT
jgi:hypothetical protein